MIKFASLMAKASYLWGEGDNRVFLRFPYRQDHWLEDPEHGFLKPYLYDAFLKFERFSVQVLPYAYGYERAVITLLTDKPVEYVQSLGLKRVLNIYIPEHDAYLHLSTIDQGWLDVDVCYKDGSKEKIDMKIFEPYRDDERPVPPEKKVEAIQVIIKNPPDSEIPLIF